jgi:hypothetical protein
MLHKDKKKKGYGSWIKNSKGTGPSDSTSTTTNRSGKDKVTEQRELGTSRNRTRKRRSHPYYHKPTYSHHFPNIAPSRHYVYRTHSPTKKPSN